MATGASLPGLLEKSGNRHTRVRTIHIRVSARTHPRLSVSVPVLVRKPGVCMDTSWPHRPLPFPHPRPSPRAVGRLLPAPSVGSAAPTPRERSCRPRLRVRLARWCLPSRGAPCSRHCPVWNRKSGLIRSFQLMFQLMSFSVSLLILVPVFESMNCQNGCWLLKSKNCKTDT